MSISGVKHTGTLVALANREHRAECACGWIGPIYYGRGRAAREYDEHMRDEQHKEDADGNA